MRGRTGLSIAIVILVAVASATGLFYRSPDAPIAHVTVRGEQATFQGSGLYRYDPADVAREGMVWDAVNLFIAVPLFVVAIVLMRRNSLRGTLLAGGMLFYFFYNYLMYATMVAFNPLFLVYVTIFALSAVAFAMNLRVIDVARLPDRISARFPRRLFIGYALGMSTAILAIWLRLITSVMAAGRFPAGIAGMNTLQTQALDLGLIVPMMVSAAILLWRRSPWGYLLMSVAVSYGILMCIVLPAWIAVPLIQGGTIDLFEAIPFLAGCMVGLIVAVLFFRSVHEPAAPEIELTLTFHGNLPT